MTNEMVPFKFERTYSLEEFDLIRQGYLGDMDTKWFIYFDDGYLSLYYGTREYGQLVFTLKFDLGSKLVAVSEAWVHTSWPRDDEDVGQFVENLIDSRFELVSIAVEKENIGPVSFWLKQGKLALMSNCNHPDNLLDSDTVLRLGNRLIELAAEMRKTPN